MAKIAKAVTAAVTAFGGTYAVAVADGSGVSLDEWVSIAVAVIVAGFGVWLVPNTPSIEE